MMYDNDREGGSKDLDIMLKFKQEIHKKGDVFAWKYKNSTILLWIWINSDWFPHSKLLNSSSTHANCENMENTQKIND